MPFDHFYASFAAVYADGNDEGEGSDNGRDEKVPYERQLPPVEHSASHRRSGNARGVPYRGRLHFPVEQLQQVYHLPLKEAALELGICEAALKRICRRNHIKKWPFRQLQSVMRRIEEESRLVAMHRVFRNSLVAVDNADSERFLLPHELEVRRNASTMEAQLEREQRQHALRVQELKREQQMIIETAHLVPATPPKHCRHDEVDECQEQPFETPSSVIMMNAISVDDPLDMLASLCASELSRTLGKESLKPRSTFHDDSDIHSVEILSCLMTKAPQEV